MSVLVVARRTDHDRTSAGICTRKYLELLGAEMDGVQCFALEPPKQQAQPRRSFVRRKAVALTRHLTGFDLPFWRDLVAYEREVVRATSSGSIKLIFAMGAGIDFTPHFAMVSSRVTTPSIAYYHDPFPLHLYPPPYAQPRSVPGWHAERWHRKVIRRASALAFPSRRLLEWVLCGDLAGYREKAFVLPHLATGIANSGDFSDGSSIEGFDQSQFNVVHTGTMLRHRSPWALLEGCRRFTEGSGEKAKHTRLWQIGRVDRHLLADSRWAEYQQRPWFQRVESRVPYDQALRVLADSACGVVLEAVAAESPFFPAKLADHLMLRKPTLAITPAASTVRDILGSDYPLLCLPDSVDAVVSALERLWEKWREGALDHLAPSPEACAMASPETALRELQGLLHYLGISVW